MNTDDMEELHRLAKRVLPIFAKVSKSMNTLPLTMKAKNSLMLYNDELEGNLNNIYNFVLRFWKKFIYPP